MLRSIAVCVTAAAALLVGCAPTSEEAPPAAETSTPSPEVPVPTEPPDPQPAETVAPDATAGQLVEAMNIRERAETVVMGQVPGTDAQTFASHEPEAVILMGDNIPDSPERLTDLVAAIGATASPAPLVGIDQEGGVVSRLPWDNLPSAGSLQDADPSETEIAFAARADLLADAGIAVNFGVVADVPRSDGSFIFSRSFGTDPAAVSDRVAAAVTGEQGRAATTLKHFPGHGAAEGDSHETIPATDMTYDEWREFDALPFQAGIDAGAELVMTGHLRFTEINENPASLSERWYEILRDDLGFEGVAVTDDLGMLLSSGEEQYADLAQNAVLAIEAGADLALVIAGSTADTPAQIADAIEAAVSDGSLPEERLNEAATRVMQLRLDAAG